MTYLENSLSVSLKVSCIENVVFHAVMLGTGETSRMGSGGR